MDHDGCHLKNDVPIGPFGWCRSFSLEGGIRYQPQSFEQPALKGVGGWFNHQPSRGQVSGLSISGLVRSTSPTMTGSIRDSPLILEISQFRPQWLTLNPPSPTTQPAKRSRLLRTRGTPSKTTIHCPTHSARPLTASAHVEILLACLSPTPLTASGATAPPSSPERKPSSTS